ncbi:hypothetical protein Bbelb_342510 [Branchiostoma belcheri]|nr:hypothetical protein Bbelb_342510 [Branchiostoma belcheri]
MNRAPLHCVCFLCLLTFGLFHQAEAAAHDGFDPVSVTAKDPYLESLKNNEVLQKLFNKYGKDGKMTFEGFQELLDRLGLGEVRIVHHEAMIIDHKEGRNSSTDTVSVVDTFGDTDHMVVILIMMGMTIVRKVVPVIRIRTIQITRMIRTPMKVQCLGKHTVIMIMTMPMRSQHRQ